MVFRFLRAAEKKQTSPPYRGEALSRYHPNCRTLGIFLHPITGMNRTARRSRLGSGGLLGSPRSLHRLSARWMRFGADWLPQRHFGLYADILPARRKNVNRVCAISAFFLTQPASDLRWKRFACQKTFLTRCNPQKCSEDKQLAAVGVHRYDRSRVAQHPQGASRIRSASKALRSK